MNRCEWIEYHNRQAERHGEKDMFFEKFCTEFNSEEHGIFQYTVENDEMTMQECIGDVQFWEEQALWICKTCGIKKIISYATTDKPKRLERLYKAKAISCTDGLWKFERVVL